MITRRRALALTPAVALGLAACGATPGSRPGGPFAIATIPNVSTAAVYIAQNEGAFEAAGLNVSLAQASGFAPNVASVINGETQVGFAALIPLLVARSKGAPIKVLAGTDRAPTEYDPETDPASIAVGPDSDISRPRDLEGRSVAVTALGAIQDAGVKLMVKNDGGDPDAVRFLVLGSADMVDAVLAGRVDAACLSEPFTTGGRAQGLVSIGSYSTQAIPGEPIAAYFTSERALERRPEDYAAFRSVIGEITQRMAADEQVVRDALPTYTSMPEQAIQKVHFYDYTTEITAQQMDDVSAALVDLGYITAPVGAEDLLVEVQQ